MRPHKKAVPKGCTAVMNRRVEPPDSLDYFPTLPFATRALTRFVIPEASGDCLEPACGEGHMARPLAEHFEKVWASDIFDYGYGEVRDFLQDGGLWGDAFSERSFDWVITNPPFIKAEAFVKRGLSLARCGVAIFIRTTFMESEGRWDDLFSQRPPSVIAQFVERVPLYKGRLNPGGSTATAYCWVVWGLTSPAAQGDTRFMWIPPCRRALERPEDYR